MILETVFKVPSEFTLILGGLGLITTAILNPEGIAGGLRIAWRSRTVRRKRPLPAKTAVAPAAVFAHIGGDDR